MCESSNGKRGQKQGREEGWRGEEGEEGQTWGGEVGGERGEGGSGVKIRRREGRWRGRCTSAGGGCTNCGVNKWRERVKMERGGEERGEERGCTNREGCKNREREEGCKHRGGRS